MPRTHARTGNAVIKPQLPHPTFVEECDAPPRRRRGRDVRPPLAPCRADVMPASQSFKVIEDRESTCLHLARSAVDAQGFAEQTGVSGRVDKKPRVGLDRFAKAIAARRPGGGVTLKSQAHPVQILHAAGRCLPEEEIVEVPRGQFGIGVFLIGTWRRRATHRRDGARRNRAYRDGD